MFDVIVVGSGPAGVHATRRILDRHKGLNVAMLDVGIKPPNRKTWSNNFESLIYTKNNFDILIGEKFESLQSIVDPYLTPKIKGPLNRFVIQPPTSQSRPILDGFYAHPSFARGGLSNVWGAQLFQFSDDDLKEFPYRSIDLRSYYNDLADHIGISGQHDDLAPYFGEQNLLPPLKLNLVGDIIKREYSKKRKLLNNEGVFVGTPRLAILSQDYRDRKAYDYSNLEYFSSKVTGIYNASVTLEELLNHPRFTYLPNHQVENYRDFEDHVEVSAIDLANQSRQVFKCSRLFLGAGVFGTSKIVLNSNQDFQTKLPVLDNQIEFIPFLIPSMIGQAIDMHGYGTLLSLVVDRQDTPKVFGCFYSLSAILRSDQLMGIPLALSQSISSGKELFPALTVLQIWRPGGRDDGGYVRLTKDGRLEVGQQGQKNVRSDALGKFLIKKLRTLGLWSHSSLIRRPPLGTSFHWCGTLPMCRDQQRYRTDHHGKLFDSHNVYIIDASAFPSLPAKNLSLTVMAHAMLTVDKALERSLNYDTEGTQVERNPNWDSSIFPSTKSTD